jgi:arginase
MNVSVLTVPYDSGKQNWRMAKGPECLLHTGIAPLLVQMGTAFQHDAIELADPNLPEIASAFELAGTVSARVRQARSHGSLPIVLSGNCLIAVGAICGCGPTETCVAWFDAHGEANTPETTKSGFLDGMGIAVLTGRCWRTLVESIPDFRPVPGEHVMLIGARDLEPAEEILLAQACVHRANNPRDLGAFTATMQPEINGIYMHFDLDVLDPAEAVANQWTPPGGLKLADLLQAVSTLCDRLQVKGFGFGSYDPAVDRDGCALRAATQIAEVILARWRS